MCSSSSALKYLLLVALVAPLLMSCGGSSGAGSSGPVPIPPVQNACARAVAGSLVQNPPDLFSSNGTLKVTFSYQTTTDAEGRQLFCFMTPDGLENPTLHVHPGDQLIINVTNNTPSTPVVMQINPPNCGATNLTGSSLNMHFHGTNISPSCHQDEIVHTLINSGQAFHYSLKFPSDEPPGVYWYHPHAHMLVESALQGGGSGAIVVEGIENFQPAVAGLDQQIMVIRDQNVAGNPTPGGDVPSWDITLNNIPIAYPAEIPAIVQMQKGTQQFWRVSNSSADTILDLQVQFDGAPQNLQIVALDGVPLGSQSYSGQPQIVNATDILIPTAGRAEFIVNAPPDSVANADLITLNINTGPDGDNDPQRTLATIQTVAALPLTSVDAQKKIPSARGAKWTQRFAGLASIAPVASRILYFSENNPISQFFITEQGATPTLFDPNNPPAIVTTQGSVEEWTIQNQTLENHEFHIHQIHYLVESQDNFEINGSTPDPSIGGQMLDTIQIPFWDGNPAHPYPSVTVRMDFRGADIGDFVYHCHIAEHEDDGMMAIIRVLPAGTIANAIARMKLYVASLPMFNSHDQQQLERVYAWCVNGRLVRKRLTRATTQREVRPPQNGANAPRPAYQPQNAKLREQGMQTASR
ncbi:MAG TPA: multicopper oxidase domain-containing protein [Candidatus Binataceae bacterium]|nr:multicopper oxidase domain-containing protein [Candidatus Binataceae bacterium]